MHEHHDCLIIGGGPAGLMAAVYLARSMRRVLVIDAGASRAALIPVSHNYPGFAEGISGQEILSSLREQAAQYGAQLQTGTVTKLERDGNGFSASIDDKTIVSAARVILASGIVDTKPNLPRMPEFIYKGAIRFCPVCDAYETLDQRIGVIGPLKSALRKALFMRTYSRNVSVLALEEDFMISDDEKKILTEAGIAVPLCGVRDLFTDGDCIAAEFSNGDVATFDTIYPAMGAKVRSQLALNLGADHNESGCVCTSDHHETSIPGLYAIGDISTELHQISVAFGHAAIAATHIHNQLPRNFR